MTPAKKLTKKVDQKSAFLTELVAGYSRWVEAGNEEYAKAYEHMICAFTMKKAEPAKKD